MWKSKRFWSAIVATLCIGLGIAPAAVPVLVEVGCGIAASAGSECTD